MVSVRSLTVDQASELEHEVRIRSISRDRTPRIDADGKRLVARTRYVKLVDRPVGVTPETVRDAVLAEILSHDDPPSG